MVLDNGSVGNNYLQELFPVDMHVLAVDNDGVCLNMLEKLLLKCHYKVTTTTESAKALEMLRENKDMFDLVICDVNMHEMDEFKFLKQVGLEMNLPVIVLSEHCDIESVMKCVINGASNYILKPIRMEEVKTMWQHVVRKKIMGKKVSVTENKEKISNIVRVCSQDTNTSNQILGKKRKERSELDNDTEGSTEMKPRFVWNNELQTKFVAAVNQLGLDKASPKKILELMKDVEGITRENISSHLQKFRLSLKRSDKHVRTDAAGGRNFIYNAPYGLNFRGMSYAPLPPPFQSQNNINCFTMPVASANERSCFLPDFRTSIQTSQFQPNNYQTCNMKLSSIEDPKAFTVSSSFQSLKVAVNNANSSFVSCIPSNQPLTDSSEVFTNHSSIGGAVVETGSPNNTLSPVASLDKPKSQPIITEMPEVVKFHSDPTTMDSNGDCFFEEMMSLQEGFFDNRSVSLKDMF